MAGRIHPDDIATVRERARAEDIMAEHLTLRNAGSGTLKGLCPFHDEKTPSFTVRPQGGLWHCFGCGEGGDLISFVEKIDNLSFSDAVQSLADRYNITLRIDESAGNPQPPNRRRRILQAHLAAAEYYRQQLFAPEARAARDLLRAKGFDGSSTEKYGVGFAPQGWKNLTDLLLGKGFTIDELLAGGLLSQNDNGRSYDRFRGRLMWPIRDVTGATIGFGARRLFDDDKGPKYLNTPETPVYHKSNVLYGLDLAKRDIAKLGKAIVVEGYTDVMACHEAGETTAVATCGTAFGAEHAKTLKRMLTKDQVMRGEVLFTFDGDDAGRKAALKTFDLERDFTANAKVATGPDGLDPCDIRVQRGDDALRSIFAKPMELYRFVVQAKLQRWDLQSIEGRVQALREVAGVVKAIRDQTVQEQYAAWVGQALGFEPHVVHREVRNATAADPQPAPAVTTRNHQGTPQEGMPHSLLEDEPPPAPEDEPPPEDLGYEDHLDAANEDRSPPHGASNSQQGPDPQVRAPAVSERDKATEREALKAIMQFPTLGPLPRVASLTPQHFQHPSHQQLFAAMLAAGLTSGPSPDAAWAENVRRNVAEHLADSISWLMLAAIPVQLDDPARITKYVDSLATALHIGHLAGRRADLLRQATALGTASSPEAIALYTDITEIDRSIHSLRAE